MIPSRGWEAAPDIRSRRRKISCSARSGTPLLSARAGTLARPAPEFWSRFPAAGHEGGSHNGPPHGLLRRPRGLTLARGSRRSCYAYTAGIVIIRPARPA
jgi:hypothetical protein